MRGNLAFEMRRVWKIETVKELLSNGLIRPRYSTVPNYFTRKQTIDVDASIVARAANRKAPLVFVTGSTPSPSLTLDN